MGMPLASSVAGIWGNGAHPRDGPLHSRQTALAQIQQWEMPTNHQSRTAVSRDSTGLRGLVPLLVAFGMPLEQGNTWVSKEL